ncbi:MAG TPA: hypothetical protein VNL15_06250 [Dehalococcoidia bacterium]|nr:hypothetical protein [Dehalococcoidia bacterium]
MTLSVAQRRELVERIHSGSGEQRLAAMEEWARETVNPDSRLGSAEISLRRHRVRRGRPSRWRTLGVQYIEGQAEYVYWVDSGNPDDAISISRERALELLEVGP